MKYARYVYAGEVCYGMVAGEELLKLNGSILDEPQETGERHQISAVKLLPPIKPTKIACIGQNYLEHIKEITSLENIRKTGGPALPQEPLYFLKPPSSLIGPAEDIIYPKMATRVDYEGELAVVIKKKMKDVPKDDAMQHVLGYSCFNDITERDLVGKDPLNLTLGKSFDTFSAFGPYIAVNLDPKHLRIRTYLNGELKQNDYTSQCVFDVPTIISYLSQCLTLYPGDIVTTGTPRGIAPMQPGDLVEVEIEGIGRLSNRVKAAEAAE